MKARYWLTLSLPVVGIAVWLARHWRVAGYKGWHTLFEIKKGAGGNARLFFSVLRNTLGGGLRVLTLCGSFCKSDGGRSAQNKAMGRAYTRLKEFLQANPEWELVTDAREV